MRGGRLESVREKIEEIQKSIITCLLVAHAIIFSPSCDWENGPENRTKSQILFFDMFSALRGDLYIFGRGFAQIRGFPHYLSSESTKNAVNIIFEKSTAKKHVIHRLWVFLQPKNIQFSASSRRFLILCPLPSPRIPSHTQNTKLEIEISQNLNYIFYFFLHKSLLVL